MLARFCKFFGPSSRIAIEPSIEPIPEPVLVPTVTKIASTPTEELIIGDNAEMVKKTSSVFYVAADDVLFYKREVQQARLPAKT